VAAKSSISTTYTIDLKLTGRLSSCYSKVTSMLGIKTPFTFLVCDAGLFGSIPESR
jgi:hypothetical protein